LTDFLHPGNDEGHFLGRRQTLTIHDLPLKPHSAEEIRSHPNFEEARDCLVDAVATLYGDNVRLIRGLVQYERASVFMLLLCLDAASRDDAPESHVSLATLCDILGEMNVRGRRRIADLVIGLRLDGFMASVPAPHDKRIRILKPTELMLEADRTWLAAFTSPLRLLFEAGPYEPARNHDPVFQKAFRLISIGELGRAGRLIANNPAIDFFLRRDVGIRVLMVLMQEVRGQKDRRTPSGFYSAAARRCHVSRNHVRNLLEEAEAMGLVSLSDVRGRYVEVLPALDQAVDRWVAEALEGMDRSTKLALAHLEQQAA
jgi:hypothetical protein